MNATSAWVPLENRVTGDRMLVLRRECDSEGEVLEVQFDLPPGAAGSHMHRHHVIEERFEVLDGALQMCVNGVWQTLTPGAAVVIRPGQAHRFRNDSHAWVSFTTELRPPVHFERFLRTWYGLANAGQSDASGTPRNLLHLAHCLHDADVTFADAPAALQRALIASVVRLGHALGAYRTLTELDPASIGHDVPMVSR